MPFDTMVMAAVTDEIGSTLIGGRVQKIIQPSQASIALAIYAQGAQRWLSLSADPQTARVNFSSERLAKAFATPSMFVMLLRKYLDGARFIEVQQVPGERVLTLHFGAGEATLRLVAEVMGKHSNVMLVDADDKILGALKIVPARQSRVRPVVPGQTYAPPPAQPRDPDLYPPGARLNANTDVDEMSMLLAGLPEESRADRALRGLLMGASPFVVRQIILSAGANPDATLSEINLADLIEAADEMYALYHTRDWQPCTWVTGRGTCDFSAFLPLAEEKVEAVPSISLAVEQCMGSRESRDALSSQRNELLRQVERGLKNASRRLVSLEEGLAAAEGADKLMQEGQMILAYQSMLQQGASELDIPDIGMKIPLDPTLTAVENAGRLFHRYRKLREAEHKLPPMIASTRTEIGRLEDLQGYVRMADSEADLRQLRSEIGEERQPEKPGKQKPKKARGPARFALDGVTALVGRNARENEEVTFRLARRDDLWLHVRQRTGAHVVVQSNGQPLAPDVLEAAAQLAAYFSEGRQDTGVDVDVTEVRHVRKIPGGAPGRVTYDHFQTVRVEPNREGWQPV